MPLYPLSRRGLTGVCKMDCSYDSPQSLCHYEWSEESRIHNLKSGKPVPRFYRDEERKLCTNPVVSSTLGQTP